jgi:hypothetical protein
LRVMSKRMPDMFKSGKTAVGHHNHAMFTPKRRHGLG